MMRIKRPPVERCWNPIQEIAASYPEHLEEYLELFSPVDEKGRYLHYNDIRYRISKKLNLDLAWSVIKLARHRQLRPLIELGAPSQVCEFFLTPVIQKAISETDRNATTASLEWMCSKIGEVKHFEYLLNNLIADEAISSSQLEGAATTTKVARELLRKARKARTPDEKMILGNFKMMGFAWEHRNDELSLELISELHRVGVELLDEKKYHPGQFRDSDDVEVVDGDGNTIHTPPPAIGLEKRLDALITWTNTEHHDVENKEYFHPLVKAISLHFAIGYEHPFRDGNGRVARALFYWYMFKNDFAAFRYIAISTLLKSASGQYGKSYLYTETDEMDLTYFIDYQCSIIIRAISAFKNAYRATLYDIEEFSNWLWDSGLYGKLNDKQKTVFQVARGGQVTSFTANIVKENLNCSYNTASGVLNGLVDLNLFRKYKKGREWVFAIQSQENIKSSWQD